MGLVSSLYTRFVCHRYDDPGYLKYFTAADFPGLTAEPVAFASGANTLRGYFYAYPDAGDALAIFCHGIGGGHLSYMKEIERLCRAGWRVLAYDNTGCFASDGDGIGGLSGSLRDLDAAVRWLKQTGAFAEASRVVAVGHSWGGYAVGNIPAFHPEIQRVVVISGFASVESLLCAFTQKMPLPGKNALIRRLLAIERKQNPAYADAAMPDALKTGETRYFFAHDENDPTVPFAANTGALRMRFPDARYRVTDDRFHNPNYTADAAKYLTETFSRFNALVKKGKCRTLADKQAFFADADWDRMTRQDEAFWTEALSFLLADGD